MVALDTSSIVSKCEKIFTVLAGGEYGIYADTEVFEQF
jgi:hypothetical protein